MGWELFRQYVRALKEAKPKYFLYENNKSMAKAIYNSISETFGFEPIMINSALVSAQNRQRYYWVGKRNENGTYSKVDISQPEDRGILLRDILEGNDLTSNNKGYTLTASYNGAVAWNTIERCQRNMVVEPVVFNRPHGFNQGSISIEKVGTLTTACYQENHKIIEPVCLQEQPYGRAKQDDGTYDRRYEAKTDSKSPALTTVESRRLVAEPVNVTSDGKAKCLRATCFKDGIRNLAGNDIDLKTGVAEPVNTSVQVGALPRPNGELSTSQAFRIYDTNAKSVTLKGCAGGAGGKTGLYAVPIEFDGDIPTKAVSYADGKTYTVYTVKDGQITIKGKTYPIKLNDGYYIIRKLTVSECKRLQTVPEWYKFPVSDTQAYKCLGNGWTVAVIKHLISHFK